MCLLFMKELREHAVYGKPLEEGSIQVECGNNATLFAEGKFFVWSGVFVMKV